MASIYLTKAVSLHLGSIPHGVVTRYELGTLVYQLYRTKKFQGQRIRITKDAPQPQDLSNVIKQLLGQGILSPDRDFPSHRVFRILGKKVVPAEVIACVVDPFAFVSHLSAMDYHGLTDRLPRSLYLSSPVEERWRDLATQRTQRDCEGFSGEYLMSGFPRLQRMAMREISQRPIRRRGVSDSLGAYRKVRERSFRVATIGRTFLDMIRDPALCGGIRHVLDVFEQHAQSYLRLIIDEVEQHGNAIDKVRAGYILDERCSVEHQGIERWKQYVQRGGSRKLDAQGDYSSEFSEEWALSINVIGA